MSKKKDYSFEASRSEWTSKGCLHTADTELLALAEVMKFELMNEHLRLKKAINDTKRTVR